MIRLRACLVVTSIIEVNYNYSIVYSILHCVLNECIVSCLIDGHNIQLGATIKGC